MQVAFGSQTNYARRSRDRSLFPQVSPSEGSAHGTKKAREVARACGLDSTLHRPLSSSRSAPTQVGPHAKSGTEIATCSVSVDNSSWICIAESARHNTAFKKKIHITSHWVTTMDKFDQATIRRMSAGDVPSPCVSLFMRTHITPTEAGQDEIRLKNLIRGAENQLSGHWLSATKARSLMSQVASLPTDIKFWQARREGLAVFVSPASFDAFRVMFPLAEQVWVADRFRFRPLLPVLERDFSFYLLVISENHVACYSVNGRSIEEVQIPDLPRSLSDTLGDSRKPPVLQTHTAMRGVRGKQSAVFHGHGGQADSARDEQAAFCAQVDRAVSAWMGDSQTPILLACVEPLAAIYRQKSTNHRLIPELMVGNWDHCSEPELMDRAIRIAEPMLAAATSKLALRYQQLVGTPNTSDDPIHVVQAALQGRVDTLFYNAKGELYGVCEPDGLNVVVTGNHDDEDLIDLAALATLRNRGTIRDISAGEFPTNSPLAAMFRYTNNP